MTVSRMIVAIACTGLAAVPALALGRPVAGVTVHSASRDGTGGLPVVHRGRGGPAYAGGYGLAPAGYAEADRGREDDAALFAARYGCARPIWNAKYNRLMAPCH